MHGSSPSRSKAFTLLEVMLAIAILAIMAATVFLIARPYDRVEESQATQALTELREIGRALQFFSLDNGFYPADVNRGLPAGIEGYLTTDDSWPNGPIPGTVYDYDNWSDKTCIDPEASGSVQITLREVPNRNPDGSDVWAWYYVIHGKGAPHCNSANEATKGECINCPGFEL